MPRSKATSTPDPRFHLQSPRFRFVGGKGGVGKTTGAAAMALLAARGGRRTLVVSTDPAPSLGDALELRLAASPKPVPGAPGLDAMELDARRAFDRWMRARRGLFETLALRGTLLDRSDVRRLLDLALPGIDEIAALLEIARYGGSGTYEHVVVDTAPTGHLLRMVELPDAVGRAARVFDRLQEQHRSVVVALKGSWRPDAADLLIAEIDALATDIRHLLTDRERCAVAWVTLPEAMAVEETADGLRALRALGMRCDALIVNRVTERPRDSCAWCRARLRFERSAMHELRRRTAGQPVPTFVLPAAVREPRGLAALRRFASALRRPASREPLRAPVAAVRRALSRLPVRAQPAAGGIIESDARLVMFGGKGGVGKTTCAAAVALQTAMAQPARRILLLSTDPAHSLGDALGALLTDIPQPLRSAPRNLRARELDAAQAFARMRERLASAAGAMLEAAGHPASRSARAGPATDGRALRDLLELAPPGVDELAAVLDVIELLDGREHDLIVMDTAPTGHALRLIETPTVVHEWVKALLAILLKYQQVMRPGELGAALVRLSQGLGRLTRLMTGVETQFIAVTRPFALPRSETMRLLARIRRAHVRAPLVVVNAAGAGTCGRCTVERTGQRKEIEALRRSVRRFAGPPALLLAPAEMPPPHGPEALAAWQRSWSRLQDGVGL